MPKLVSLNIALPALVQLDGTAKKFRTGMFKKPVNERIYLDKLGFHGDGVGDTRIHGGNDLAVCAYFVDHFSFWNNELNRLLEPGAFGENLSLTGIDETQINVGDVFSLGEAEIEVSQPRQPCHKLNKVFKYQGMACKVQTTGFTGCYFRVKKKGWVEPGAAIEKVQDGLGKISIDKINTLMFKEKNDINLLSKVVSQEALSLEWREKFEKRLKSHANP